MKWLLKHKVRGGFVAALAIVVANALVSYENTVQLIENEKRLAQTHQVITELKVTLSSLKDVETGQQGYLLTGNDSNLELYFAAIAQTQAHIQNLKRLTADNPNHQRQIARLRQKITEKVQIWQVEIATQRLKGFNPQQQALATQFEQLISDIRQEISAIENSETKLLLAQRQQSQSSLHKTIATFCIATFVALALIVLLYYFIRRDIRERQEAEKKLRESEQKYRSVVDNVKEVIFQTDAEGLWTFLNPAWTEITGFTVTESIGTNFLNYVHPDDREHNLALFKPLIDRKKNYCRHEIRYLTKDDGCCWIEVFARLTLAADDTIIGTSGTLNDISERKQAEEKIREQAALLDITTDAIFVRDMDNHICFWNQGAQRLYEWQETEVLSKKTSAILSEEKSPQFQEAWKMVILAGEWRGELNQVTKSGREIIVESRWTLMRDEENQPKSILTVNTEITEQKKLESQLLRSQRMESIGTLAGGIAHDLNNVLAPILMSLQLLQMKYPDNGNQRLLKTLEHNAKRGANLVKQVLSFARGMEGKRTIVQTSHLILEIEHIVRETFPKSIELNSDIAPNLRNVHGDITQLHQVLMNLVVNARDAMPNGGILTISAENLVIDKHYAQMNIEATEGAYVVITVADTGMGMPPEIQERIFEPFFTTKELGKGTGLGLSTVMGIIKNHDGFVHVYSEVGRGTQFKVYLPATAGSLKPQHSQKTELLQGDGELILVVDDEAAIRDITKTSLEAYNYKVMTACDGVEALAIYAQYYQKISLVLLDMMMPSMDGAVTIRTLQKINPQVKIIAISGLASNEKIAEASGIGVKAFLSKPCTAEELLKTIHIVKSAT
jgi:PAS domain S-box-containing protein